MKKSQFFSHRPPSNTTLLSDPWPASLQPRKHRKTFEWPEYRNIPRLAGGLKLVAGLHA